MYEGNASLERTRRGETFIESEHLYPVEQERSLEVPLGYPVAREEVRPARPVAVILHAFHVELLPEFRGYLAHIPYPADLFVSTDTEEKRRIVADCFAGWPFGRLSVKVVPNRGRDIAPKVVGFASVYPRYDYVLHLHTKQSPHDRRLVGWRPYILDTLLGSQEVVQGIFSCFSQAPRLGMIAPQHIDDLRPWIRWAQNYDIAQTLAGRMGFPLPPGAPLDFPSGSMFWARSAALQPLLALQLSFADFPEETGRTDGTLAHAIERLYFHICEQAGYDWLKITAQGQLHDQRDVALVTSPVELAHFLSRAPLRLSALTETVRRPKLPTGGIAAQPKPRRATHVLWRKALGESLSIPPESRLAIVLYGGAAADDRLANAAQHAVDALRHGAMGKVILVAARELDGPCRTEALRAGFATGADVVLLLSRPGLICPRSAEAVLRMALAHGGRALIEGNTVPDPAPREVDPQTLSLSWAGGPALAVTRSLFEATGGFAQGLSAEAAERDLSTRARSLGFAILRCPLFQFAHKGQD